MEPEILAEVSFFLAEQGGRGGPTASDHFGCSLKIGSQLFDCRLILSQTGSVAPGEVVTVPIKFLCPELALPHLQEGTAFELWEGRIVASGRVLSFLHAA